MPDRAGDLRRALAATLRERGALTDPRVEAAFLEVPRERFLSAAGRELPLEEVYADDAIVTRTDAHGRPRSSSSQPGLMARMLEQVEIRPGDRVLEIGTGTGYNAALLARLVGPTGAVTSIDVDPSITAAAARALAVDGTPVTVLTGDGRDGDPAGAPYDRVIVTASAAHIPAAWRDQLTGGGRLQLPLRLDADGAAVQVIPVLERRGDRLTSVALTWGGFMPLHGGDGKAGEEGPPPPALSGTLTVPEKVTPLLTLTGAPLAGVSASAAQALLGEILGERWRTVREGTTEMSGGRTPLLLLHLLLAIAPERRVSLGGPRIGVGVLDAERGGLALLTVPSPWRGDVRSARDGVPWQAVAVGEGGAAAELEHLLDAWERLAAGGRPELTITASGGGDPLEVDFGWSPG